MGLAWSRHLRYINESDENPSGAYILGATLTVEMINK